MKKISYIIGALLLAGTVNAQNFADGFRLSQNLYMGTARSTAMGNAFGALGADVSAISINPAGLGVYRTSEFVFTPSISFGKVDASYMGTKSYDTKLRMNFNNVGYVYTGMTGNSDGLISISMGLTYNRMNDFKNNYLIRGDNNVSSLAHSFVDYANAGSWSDYHEELAWDTYALYYDDAAGVYGTDISEGQQQTKKIETNGSKGEWLFALGGNISNILYFGGSIGLESFYYDENSGHTEVRSINNPGNFDIRQIYFRENYSQSGSGVNLKLGAIVRPVDFFRFGLSIQAPTSYVITQQFGSYMETQFFLPDSLGYDTYEAYPNDVDGNKVADAENTYRFRTPMRVTASTGITLAKMLAIGIDAELVDYSRMMYRSSSADPSNYDDQNDAIQANMKSVVNLRAGLELKLQDFYLRGGAGYYMSPYKSSTQNAYVNYNSKNDMITASTGFGYRSGGFIFDVAYTAYMHKEDYFLYDSKTLTEPAKLSFLSNRLIATIGFKF